MPKMARSICVANRYIATYYVLNVSPDIAWLSSVPLSKITTD